MWKRRRKSGSLWVGRAHKDLWERARPRSRAGGWARKRGRVRFIAAFAAKGRGFGYLSGIGTPVAL